MVEMNDLEKWGALTTGRRLRKVSLLRVVVQYIYLEDLFGSYEPSESGDQG
jgi:hypothetical protein